MQSSSPWLRLTAPGAFTDADNKLLAQADALYEACRTAMDRQAIKTALDAVWAVVGEADRYFTAEKPFDKTLSPERKGTILYVAAEVVRQIAILAQPAMPQSAGKVLDLLGQTGEQRSFASLGEKGRLAPGLVLPAPVGVFPRYVDPEAEAAPAAKAKSAKARKQQKKG